MPYPSQAQPYRRFFDDAGFRWAVAPALLAAIAEQESSFNARAVGPTQDYGLMQITSSTARALGFTGPIPEGLYDPATSVDLAARLLRENVDRAKDWRTAVAAYNAGWKNLGSPGAFRNQSYVDSVARRLERIDPAVHRALGFGPPLVVTPPPSPPVVTSGVTFPLDDLLALVKGNRTAALIALAIGAALLLLAVLGG